MGESNIALALSRHSLATAFPYTCGEAETRGKLGKHSTGSGMTRAKFGCYW
jgi:hypothetical protein